MDAEETERHLPAAPGTELKIAALGTDAGPLPAPSRDVRLLGSDATLEWRQRADGLAITCPSAMPFSTVLSFRVS